MITISLVIQEGFGPGPVTLERAASLHVVDGDEAGHLSAEGAWS